MSAFTVAFAIGENGGEGRMSGLLFSALALATLARMATVATGFNADPALNSGAAMAADAVLGDRGRRPALSRRRARQALDGAMKECSGRNRHPRAHWLPIRRRIRLNRRIAAAKVEVKAG